MEIYFGDVPGVKVGQCFKNKKLEDKVSTLIARLERLEKVALNESKSQDLATIKLP